MSAKPTRTKQENDEEVIKAAFVRASESVPAWAKPAVVAAGPVVATGMRLANQAAPYVVQGYNAALVQYEKLKPYHPELAFPMVVGLIMMMFGGTFMTLIAVVEAYRICGYEGTVKALGVIWESFSVLKKKSDEDDQKDEDGNGVPDVQEIPANQLVSRKFFLFLKNCNPHELSGALSGLYAGFVAVMAVLKLQFARTISLGAAIGDMVQKPADRFLRPQLLKAIPEDFHKWIDVILSYTCRAIGVSIALTLRQVLAAVHSAFRGATIFTEAFAKYTATLGYEGLSKGYWDEAFCVVCALFGLYLQLSTGFSLPWFLAIPLFPLVAVENVLKWIVSWTL